LNFLLGRILSLRKIDIILSFLFHIFLTFVSLSFVESAGGDSQFYYSSSKMDLHGLNSYFGGNFIIDLVGIFSRYLNLSYFNTTIIFSSIGYSGILIVVSIIKNLVFDLPGRYKYIYYLILFSPSLHFWTSLIGKDNLCLFFISLILISLIRISENQKFNYFFLILISLISIFLIRPHFSFIILLGIFINILLVIFRKTYFSLLILIFLLPLILFGLNYLASFIQSSFPYEGNITEIITGISEVFAKTEDNTFQSTYTPIISEFRYLLAPFPNFNGGAFGIISNMELLPYFLLFLKPIFLTIKNILTSKTLKIYEFVRNNSLIGSFYIISILFTIILSATQYNMGVVIRQKTIISPFYIISFLIYIRQILGLNLLGVNFSKSN